MATLDRLVDKAKLSILLLSLCLCSAMAGSSFGARLLLKSSRRHVNVQPLIKSRTPLAMESVANRFAAQSTETSLAIQSERIDELAKQNQVSIDDRNLLHNEITTVANLENQHYNTLNDRLNVNDARVMTIGWILGVLFTLSQAIVVFFHIDGRRARRQQDFVPPPIAPSPRRRATQRPPPQTGD